ncbi:MAG: xanthine dehydrogenase family protein molybdopterin-binding subunit, partial [Acidimicrobiales bacterium]
MTATEEHQGHVGSRRLRKEDPALLTGESKFIDDLDIPGALWMSVIRSPHAHAKITSIDLTEALASPGVVAAYTGTDLLDLWAAPLPCAWPVTEDMKNPPHYPVTPDIARYVGDAVAIVLANSRYEAADAATTVIVEYDVLPAVPSLEDATADNTQVYPDEGTNAAYTWELIPDAAAVDQAFTDASHTVKGRYVQQRLIPAAMEPRGVAAVPSPFNGEMTMYSATQIPHILKVMTTVTLGIPEHKLRIIAPSVGGGFGSKLDVYAEEMLCTALANKRSVPVRWTESRSEGALSTIHGRGQIQEIELAANSDGKISAVRVHLDADMGAYMQLLTGGVPLLGGFLYHGVYDVANYSFACTGHFTNLPPTDAYRGAGRPEATFAIERTMDLLAREVGIDVAEIRRRNFIPPDAFPYSSAAGLVWDSGDYAPGLEMALEAIGYEKLRDEQRRRLEANETKLIGIGVVT